MSPLKIGTRDVKAVKIGSRNISRIMHGSREIWAAGGPSPSNFPVIAAVNTSSVDSLASTHQVALPAGITAGDLLIAFVHAPSSTSGAETLTPPAGWSLIEEIAQTGRTGAYYRIATGDEGATVSFETGTNLRSVHHTYRINTYTGAPVGVAEYRNAQSDLDCPEVTVPWGSDKNLWLAVGAYRSSQVVPSAAPAGFTDLLTAVNPSSALTSRGAMGSARRFLEAGALDPGAFTVSGSPPSGWAPRTLTVAIRGA